VSVECSVSEQTLTDSDANGGNYGPNESYTITLCAVGGNSVTVYADTDVGSLWDVQDGDNLSFFDGLDASAPPLGTFNTVNQPGGFQVTSSLDNPTGCVTAVFTSDGATEGAGFSATVVCVQQWQPYTVSITADPPALPTDTDYVDVCLGDTVRFFAIGDYPYNQAGPGGYNQNNENINFKWVLGDGSSFEGIGYDTLVYVFNQRAGYNIYLTATDTVGQMQYFKTRVRVGTIPLFDGTYADNDTICLGETTVIHGGATPVEGHFLAGGTFGEQLYLPDGNGASYETTITISGFPPNQNIVNASDLQQICMNMEHSFLGDLDMSIICPNGQSVLLKEFPGGGGTYLGGAIDNNSGPGTGADYCFSMSAVWGTMVAENNAGNWVTAGTPAGNSMTPGTYTPFEDFSQLIGCPINGDWTIQITDNQSIDDGYIFSWSLYFDASINPAIESYTPTITDQDWMPNPTIVSTNGSDITVQPGQAGNFSYTFWVEDDFGCTYDTTITLNVVPNLTSFADASVCALTYDLEAAVYPIVGLWTGTGPGSISFSPNDTTQSPSVTVTEPGPYTFIYESDYCGQKDTMEVFFRLTPQDVVFNDTIICPGDTLTFDALNVEVGPDYLWTPGGSTGQTFSLNNIQQSTQVSVSISNECGTADGSADITVNIVDIATSIEVCLGTDASLNANNVLTGGVWSYEGPGDVTFSPDANAEVATASATVEGSYTFTFTDNYCAREISRDVAYAPIPTVDITVDTNRICWEDQLLFVANTNTNFLDEFYWSPNAVNGDSLLITGNDNSTFISTDPTDSTQAQITVTVSNFCGTETESYDFEIIDCTLIIPNVFNPNADNVDNRTFHIAGLDLHPGNHVIIYDRWGIFTYEADNYHLAEWKGENASDGVYYYIITRNGYDAQTGYVHLVGSAQ
jgi:subtilisin-like proprotein convertase family protein